MDPAQKLELEAVRLQEPMNAVISKGNSAVQLYYRDTTVFVTGGTGFLGKQLIEKLFRSCAIKKLYLLSRPKKGRTMQERLQHMLRDPVFDSLGEKKPHFADLIVPVEGDVADVRLGLCDRDWNMLAQQVNVIFHVAATVRFDEPLRVATLTNVRGTREAMTLAKHCANFKKLVHVSTAFVHATRERIDTDVLEQFYPSPVPPDAMIALAEHVDNNRLDDIASDLIKGWPNTYTFTKALAEELLRTSAGELPVCIVRPSIVLPAYYEPNPGWLDITTVMGPSGMYLGAGLGVIHVFHSTFDSSIPMCPVDYTNNATIAAAWHSDVITDKPHGIPVYTVTKNLSHGSIVRAMEKAKSQLSTASAIWLAYAWLIKNEYLYFVVTMFLHYIPAYFMDFVCMILGKKPKAISSFVDIYKKVDKLIAAYDYFLLNEWNFKDDNLREMTHSMSDADKAIFNCDPESLDLKQYIVVWGIGVRKYIIKDGLKNTDVAVKKQKMFVVLNYIVSILYAFVLWYIFRTAYILITHVLLSVL